MRRWMSMSLMTLVVTSAAFAQDATLRRLDTGFTARGWEAVGRLNIEGQGFCTGALIAPNLVLTAAHCLYEKESGTRIDAGSIEFLAGWRNGRASAYRNVKHAVVHPDFANDADVSSQRVRYDLALLELDHPVRNGIIRPFGTAAHPRQGEQVGVVSYTEDRSNAPALQEICEVLSQQEGILVTSCDVDFGASGAPIFAYNETGGAEIVSVVSAKAEVEGQDVALGSSLGAPLATLRAELVSLRETFGGGGTALKVVPAGEARSGSAAKFVKP